MVSISRVMFTVLLSCSTQVLAVETTVLDDNIVNAIVEMANHSSFYKNFKEVRTYNEQNGLSVVVIGDLKYTDTTILDCRGFLISRETQTLIPNSELIPEIGCIEGKLFRTDLNGRWYSMPTVPADKKDQKFDQTLRTRLQSKFE